MTQDQTVDFVIGFLVLGLTVLGLGSIMLGKVVRWWDRVRGVNRSQDTGLDHNGQTAQTDQTETQTDQGSVADRWLERMQLDRTRTALIELLVYSDWEVGQIRSVLKGDNGTIGAEIEAARKRLGLTARPPNVTPIAHRPTEARYPT